ncbi:zinc finger CCHC domain-containing protein 2 isoform X2 [Coregonus clupeaformis]|uniref:zinc finger CCHC domain-containing protein 2 isoform X2 n=1 Tax=Coregonus clupeaformis TaxID=59861 RepID=UPI001BDF932F|nr:zinc finger CCHC domain-containing protein 2 isoform X2 [Coregonus clupeaformis]
MLKMKLPMRTSEEEDHTVEDEQENTDCNSLPSDSIPYCGVSHRLKDSTRESCRLSQIDKETVFEWFGLHLNPAKRIEFMYGILNMCQPLELRFFGSCLEDLARKDFHVFRDFEIRANSQTDLGLLMDVADPVVRSKLLVCLSLLRSENRECASTLYRALSHMDPTLYLNTYHGVPLSPRGSAQNLPDQHSPRDGGMESGKLEHPSGPPLEAESGSLEHLALLFTMASLHPAFSFHQRDTARHQLDNVERAIEERRYCHNRPSVQQKQHTLRKEDLSPRSTDMGQSACCIPNQLLNRTLSQREAVHIDKIVLKKIFWNRGNREYSIEVQWSDSTWSTVTKTHHELYDFLSKLPCERSSEPFEKELVRLLAQRDQYEPRDVERMLQDMLLSAPAAFRQRGEVCRFLLPHCSHCKCLCPCLSLQGDNTVPLGKTCKAAEHFKEDCTEPSSQDEDLESHHLGHQTECSSKRLGQSILLTKSSQSESQRPALHLEHNGVVEGRRKPDIMSCWPDPHQKVDEKWAFTPELKSRRKPDEVRSEGAKGYIPNGIIRPLSTHVTRQGVSKKPVQDRYGDTWSESSSSPSSPQHEARESLESEDLEDLEEERDTTESYSDHCVQQKRAGGHSRGKVVATVHPMVLVPHKEEPSYTDSPRSVQPLPLTVQNGPTMPDVMVFVPPQPGDGSPAEGALTGTTPMVSQESISSKAPLGDPERQRHVSVSAPLNSQPAIPGSSSHPILQCYRTPTSPDSRSTNPQPPMGAISVIPPNSHMSPLQQTCTTTDPASTATLPRAASLPNPNTRPQALAVPTSLPTPTYVTPSSGATVTPAAISQDQATLLPAVPTHTPGPVSSQALTLTHSTAQGDGTSSCSSSGVAAGQAQQKLQAQQQAHPPQQQQMSCNTCGCHGSCGSSHSPNPNFYFPPQLGRQVFSTTHLPLFHLPSMCSTGYPSHRSQVQHQSNGTTQLPFYPPPPHTATPTQYVSGPLLHTSHSNHMLATQAGYNLQQMAAASFNRFYTPMFSSVGVGLGTGMKKSSANVSCYNCGLNGHYAQDCKQPSMDAGQQGGFRLKYTAPHSSEADKTD